MDSLILRRWFLILMVVFSREVLAADSYVYTGIDVINSEVKNEFDEKDALLVLGMKVGLDRHQGIVFEGGFNDKDRLQGVELRAALLYRLDLDTIDRMTPFISGGGAWVSLSHMVCGYEIFANGLGYSYSCGKDMFSSTGAIIDAGINIRLEKSQHFTIKLSRYHGNENVGMDILSFAVSF